MLESVDFDGLEIKEYVMFFFFFNRRLRFKLLR